MISQGNKSEKKKMIKLCLYIRTHRYIPSIFLLHFLLAEWLPKLEMSYNYKKFLHNWPIQIEGWTKIVNLFLLFFVINAINWCLKSPVICKNLISEHYFITNSTWIKFPISVSSDEIHFIKMTLQISMPPFQTKTSITSMKYGRSILDHKDNHISPIIWKI